MRTEVKPFAELVKEAIEKMRNPEADTKKTRSGIDKSANIVDEWRSMNATAMQPKRSY